MKILCIGHTSYDITCPMEDYPIENTKYRLTEKVESGGGPASNAAYLLGKWGMDVWIATVIGSDDFGEKIKKEFSSVGVKTDLIETTYEKATSLSFIIINKKSGTRTVFNVADEYTALKKYQYEFTPDIIYTDGHDYGAAQNAITKFPNAIRIVDAGRVTKELLELCKYMHYIVCSKGFAETVSGLKINFEVPNTLVNVYSKLKARFPSANIIITLQEKGALYVHNNQVKIMPGLKVEAKDTTGAGDIFHGAFTYGIANKYDLEKCITLANIAGGLSVKTVGSRASVPALSTVLDEYAQKMNVMATSPANQNAPQAQMQTQVSQPSTSTPEKQVVASQTPQPGITEPAVSTNGQGQQ